MSGIVLLGYEEGGFAFNPLGDTLAFLSTLGWAAYSLLILKIMQKANNLILVTRRIIFYGILGMLPSFFFWIFSPNLANLLDLKVTLNLLFYHFLLEDYAFFYGIAPHY